MFSSKQRCFVGFDGFIDTICHVVQKRHNSDEYERYNTISAWASAIEQAASRSANFEIKVLQERLGGNAMILAKALSSLGYGINWAANVGAPGSPRDIHPLFHPLCGRSHQYCNLGVAGQTQALEFSDGKLIMGIQGEASCMTLASIQNNLGRDWIETWLEPCALIALVNWTMTLNLGQLWKELSQKGLRGNPFILIDLADPRKRNPEDLHKDLITLDTLKSSSRLILSMNRSEAEQVAALFHLDIKNTIDKLALTIRQKLPWFAIVIHDRQVSALASEDSNFLIDNPTVSETKVATGGGDHFNAGFSHALLQGCSWRRCLQMAAGYASEFVRTGQTPNPIFISTISTQ